MKKGFTLVELLGVIVILTVIGFIAVPAALNMYRGSKEELSDLAEQVLITSTKSYVNDNENDFPIYNGNVYCVSLKKVVRENYLKTPVIDANTGEEIDLNKIVEVKVTNGKYDIFLNDSCVIFINEPFTMTAPDGVINEHGWAKEDFNVSVSGDGLIAYKYCISDKICKPNIEVNQSSGLIPINTEGIHYLCAHGINAEGNTDVQCDIYKLDKTDPVIGSIALSGTEGLNGYYVSDVYVSNTPSTDALSGILTDILSPNAGTVTTDTEGTVYTLTATDKAGNTSSTSYTLKIDKTPPTNGKVEFIGTKGDNDWYISDVTVKLYDTNDYTMSSNISSITTDTKGTIVTVKTIDKAGNENPKDYVIKVDKTKPVVGTFNIVGTLGDNGWYTSDLTISAIDGSDATSGHVSSSVDITSITSNTEGTVVTLITKNGAGLTSTDTITIKVDKDKPILIAKDGPFEIYKGDNVDSKTYFNAPTYSISEEGSYTCSPANTSSLAVGTQTITCTATGGNGLSTTASVEIEVVNPVYLVTLDNQSATTAGTTSVNATYGSAMPSITLPAKTGYTFGGYYTGTNGSGTQYYTNTGASARNWDQAAADTLYAKWTANQYAVTLNNQSATTAGTTSVNATYGSAMPSITLPKKTGYTFGGYYTSTNGSGTQYYTNTGASAKNWDQAAEDTLYAKWTANQYTITFNKQSGTGGTSSTTATYGSAMPEITLPTRTCYAFGGYYTSTGGSGTQYYAAKGASYRDWDKTSNTTLYAKWTEDFGEVVSYYYSDGNCGNLVAVYECGREEIVGYSACQSAPSCYITMSPTSFSVGSAQTITLYATCDVDASTLTSNSWSGLKYTNGESDRISGYKIGIPSGAKVGTTSEWAGSNTITFTACNAAGCDTSYVTYTVN